jgi:DNA repair exonuclease SbcCD ATPase subunit
LEEKKKELAVVEKSYADRLGELESALSKETDARKTVEVDLAKVKKELEDTIRDRPSKVNDLKQQIEIVKNEKVLFQKQLTTIRKELQRLQAQYTEGQPIPELIEQAKKLLVDNSEIKVTPINFNMAAAVAKEDELAKQQAQAAAEEKEKKATAAAAAAAAAAAGGPLSPGSAKRESAKQERKEMKAKTSKELSSEDYERMLEQQEKEYERMMAPQEAVAPTSGTGGDASAAVGPTDD